MGVLAEDTKVVGFSRPEDVTPGRIVVDKDRDMVARVDEVDGRWVEVSRPTGLSWRVSRIRLRPGTEREARQLRAIGRLHQQQRRGLA